MVNKFYHLIKIITYLIEHDIADTSPGSDGTTFELAIIVPTFDLLDSSLTVL